MAISQRTPSHCICDFLQLADHRLLRIGVDVAALGDAAFTIASWMAPAAPFGRLFDRMSSWISA